MPREPFHDRRSFLRDRPYSRGPLPQPSYNRGPHHALLEELEIHHAEHRRVLSDNRRLVEDRMALQRELGMAKAELSRMHLIVADIRTEQDQRLREQIDRALKLEADLRAMESVRKDATQLRAEVHQLNQIKDEFHGQLRSLRLELVRLQADNKEIPHLQADIESLRRDLALARTTIEHEKHVNMELVASRQAMENNMVSMAREVEKLRAGLAAAGGRAWVTGGSTQMPFNDSAGAFYAHRRDGHGAHLGAAAADRGPFHGPGSSSREKPHTDRR